MTPALTDGQLIALSIVVMFVSPFVGMGLGSFIGWLRENARREAEQNPCRNVTPFHHKHKPLPPQRVADIQKRATGIPDKIA